LKKINLLDLLNVVSKAKNKPYRAKTEARQGKGRQQDFNALKGFISLKNESRKIGRTEKNRSIFSFEKNQNSNHITCKNKTHQKTGFKGAF
jgi:hypothetical protein